MVCASPSRRPRFRRGTSAKSISYMPHPKRRMNNLIRSVRPAKQANDTPNELRVLLLDPLADGIAHEAGDLDRGANLAFRLLDRLCDAALRRVGRNKGLLEQAGFLVEGLEP